MSTRDDASDPKDPVASPNPTSSGRRRRDRTVMSSPYLHKLQRRHFMLFDVLPAVGTGVALWLWYRGQAPTAVDLTLFGVMWALTGFSLSIGYHRLFTHRAFKTSLPVRLGLTIFGCMAARSSMITWTAQHRRHHQLADHEGDVHSPNLHGPETLKGKLRGWLYSQFTWMLEHDYPNVAHYVPDLLADKAVTKADRLYYRWIVLGLVLPGVVGGLVTMSWAGAVSGALWGGVVRMFVVAQQVSLLNSLNHMIGSRPFKMADNRSHNILLAGLLTWGEGWHNNHHAFPESATFGFRWYQLDPGYGVIRLMELCRLVWDVKRPTAARIEARRAKLEALNAEDRFDVDSFAPQS